jgi:hypothetical protein
MFLDTLVSMPQDIFKCKSCGSPNMKGRARGLCRRCYLADYKRCNAARLRARQKEYAEGWYRRNARQKRASVLAYRTGGNRERALERAGYRCEKCGERRHRLLGVWHLDGRNWRHEQPNHAIGNLIVLCRHCAPIILLRHGWSDEPGCYPRCLNCERIDRSHMAHGLCTACYQRLGSSQRLFIREVRAEDASEADRARFWQHVDRRSSAPCWLWTASGTDGGYGYARAGRVRVLAHRLSFALANGAAEQNVLVCHSCDTPECVNPAHLFAATSEDNIQDAIRKGRMRWQRKDQPDDHP